jgi:sugar (pentulose or hexulose) kinase
MSRFLLGIDAGSSVTKAAVFDRYGNQLARGFQRTELKRPQPGWSEVDPGAAWEAAKVAIRMALTAGSLTGDDIAAVGISAAMVGAWLVDEHGNALRPGINWEDCRTQDMLDRRVSSDPTFYHRIFQSDGCVMQQGCTLPLIAWLREHEGGAVERAAHIFSYKDFLRMKLTGRAAADRTEAAVAPGDARMRDRSPGMLELFGLTDLAAKLPDVRESESLAGTVSGEAALATGLREGTPVAIGAGDVPSTVTGASALEDGMTMAILGTTCMVGVVSDVPVFSPPDLGLLFTLPGETWYRAMVNVAGTLNLDWAIATIMREHAQDPDRFAIIEEMIADIPIGSEGVVFLPYLSESGIIAPVVATRARAGFHGLVPRHERGHLMRAVYEGVVLAIRDLLEVLPSSGGDILLTGGGAASRPWTQMIADALGRTVLVPEGTEFGARGAALLAGTAIGWFPSVRDASISTRRIDRRHEPERSAKPAWDRAFTAYRAHRDRILRSGH